MKNDFCYEVMFRAVTKYKIIDYGKIDRRFQILFGTNFFIDLYYCPWCGQKFSTILIKELLEILEKEYGIEYPDFTNFTNVPEEFKTDEWWKKRGL